MNNEARARILRMVSEGRLTPSEAEELLDALDDGERASGDESIRIDKGHKTVFVPSGRGRHLVIQVNEGGASKVNLRIPLSLARAAGRFVPRQAQAHLSNFDINLQQILEGINGSEGTNTLLEVNDGEDHVRIAVE